MRKNNSSYLLNQYQIDIDDERTKANENFSEFDED